MTHYLILCDKYCIKGGLISVFFWNWHKAPKKGAKSLSIFLFSAQDSDLAPFLRDLGQIEKFSKIKPPLVCHHQSYGKINCGASKIQIATLRSLWFSLLIVTTNFFNLIHLSQNLTNYCSLHSKYFLHNLFWKKKDQFSINLTPLIMHAIT